MSESPRHSEAAEVPLITDPQQVAYREVYNTLQQFELVSSMVTHHLESGKPFRLRPSHLLDLHRAALAGLSPYPGVWRASEVQIHGSRHVPPGPESVPAHIEDMCEYVNENWGKSPMHLAAYVMWKLNWIHPFTDGNGRTSRAASYFVLNVKLGYVLPGRRTIPDQIAEHKDPYYDALDAADTAWAAGKIELTQMKDLLSSMLAEQLLAVHTESGKEDI
jgi:Fic family protein